MTPSPLTHADPARSDDRLAADAASHLGRNPGLQLVTELLTRLREMEFPWWTPDQLREAYPASVRMRWFAERPDLRQRITTQLTGLAQRASRNKTPEFQAALVDSVIDESDISVAAFEDAFEPSDLATYGPAADFFRLFRRRMPWDDDATPHQDLVGWLIGALLSDRSMLDGSARTPILNAVQIRMAIDGRVWHSRIPLHVRVAIDDARFAAQRDRPTEPYGVERDLAIATPALIAASIPLRDLLGVIDVAAAALGFDEASAPQRAQGREASTKPSSARADSEDGGPGAEPSAASKPPSRAPSQAPPAIVRDTSPPRPGASIVFDEEESDWTRRSVGHVGSVHEPEDPETEGPGDAPGISIGSEHDLDSSDAPEISIGEVSVSESVSEEAIREAALDRPAAGSPLDRPAPDSTIDRAAPDSSADELEHTNPWIVPNLAGEIAQIAQQLASDGRDKKKGDS